jgi:hypothetical protein
MTLSSLFVQVPSSEKVTRENAQQEASLPLSELELVSNNAQSSDACMQSLQAREMLQKEARVLQMLKVTSCYPPFYLPFICVDSNSLPQIEDCDRFLPICATG